jgi:predicted nucleic acid-binding Zn ribbon protein
MASMLPLANVVPAAVIELLRSAPLSDGKVSFAWRTAVGPALERSTTARLEGRVLVVVASDPQWMRELERSREVILARVRSLLGASVVSRLEVRSK